MKKQKTNSTIVQSLKVLQRLKSIPHYFLELKKIHSIDNFHTWLQYKMPYLYPVPDFPPRITLELTNKCNLNCKHCHRSVMNRDLGVMDYPIIEKIIDEISGRPNFLLKIGGLGEPSLHKDCCKILKLLRDRKIKYIYYTNGTLLRNVLHEEILTWEIPHLVISIDGIDAQSYENIRVGGNHKQLRADLQSFYTKRNALKYKKTMIEIRHVILPGETPAQITHFKKFWKKVADTVMFCHYIPSESINYGNSYNFKTCRDIRRELYIRWNGRVPLCGYQYLSGQRTWIADIHDVSIQEAWNDLKLQEIRDCHFSKSRDIPKYCKACVHVI